MLLSNIFAGAPEIEIATLSIDSRQETKNGMFFCLEGLTSDGHAYIGDAIAKGAVCIVHAKEIEEKHAQAVYIKVENVADVLALVASKFYDAPSKKMKVIGITGTNGKTTTASIIQDIINQSDACGYIGTLHISYGDHVYPPTLTTPDPITLNYHMAEMVKSNVNYVALEVSSHGLELKRVAGLDFDIALFTNLTHDHLDFHGTVENYFEAKAKLFRNLKPEGLAILNHDSNYFERFRNIANGRVITYGMDAQADYYAKDVVLSSSQSEFNLVVDGRTYPVTTNLVATYNIYNLLGVIATLHQLGYELNDIIARVTHVKQVEGRLERIECGQDFNVVVDFAHTPDGLEKIFQYARDITPENDKVIAVFGSAGRRDKNKRKTFGELADRYCDKIILTEDDPRDEDPKEIAMEIRSGIVETSNLYIEDRYAAIRLAIETADSNDTVVILGKGNEVFMYREDGKEPYLGDHIIAKEVIEKYILHIEGENE
ncbi:MAG: UDP-N-acetylmuramoyl-L-alanyl-D-glutamate--2,6-diaminopimelate ligase [Erysipelotrichaceae bacterium]